MRLPRSYSLVAVLLSVTPLTAPANAQSSMCGPVSNNPLVMANLCSSAPNADSSPAVKRVIRPKPPESPLTLTVEQVNQMVLDAAPAIHPGNFMVFETNRRDFVLHLFLSNGKEIVTQPLTTEDAEDTSIAWRTGRILLDYPEALNQRVVGQKLVPLHPGGTPLLIRGIKIDGRAKLIFELEKSVPSQAKPTPVEPPMSYPPDPHVMTASASKPDIWGHRPETGFLAPKLPTFSMHPMMFQSTTSTSDPNHFKWNGKELDAETGLYNFGARYYSPALGRFTSPDPKVMSKQRMFDPQQWNMYSYSRNNPTSMFDPDGKEVRALDAGALNHIRHTLPASVRSSIVTNKNGFISHGPLNAIKSSDGNVQALKQLVNNPKTVEVSTGQGYTKADGKSETFFYRSDATERAQRTADGVSNTPGKDYTVYHTGQTLTPSEGVSGNEEVHISDGTGKAAEAPDIELTVTTGHELYVHALRDINGQPSEHEVRDPNGAVNKESKEVEDRTRKNAQEKDPK